MLKKTKVVCTIGPASNNKETLSHMIQAGMNVARLNFSHGTLEEHKKNFDLIKEVRKTTNKYIAIMLDTKGPEIRTGRFQDSEIFLTTGQRFTFKTEDVLGTKDYCQISDKDLYKVLQEGDRILLDDGLIEMVVTRIVETDIECQVINGGVLKDHKGVNVPGVNTNLPPVSDKDRADILFGIENGIDFIAASFIRKADNIRTIKKILAENGGEHIRVIAKIENAEGIRNIDEIIQAADGVMVARGDMGVEMPMEQVPLIQKEIIHKCNFAGKPVITATQMLDSMIRNPRPTRAEVADVANAIFDGTDAIMLSGETASGKYPVEAVEKMREIALVTEAQLGYEALLQTRIAIKDSSITDAIGYATCTSAQGLKAAAILTPTTSGYTPMVVSKFRPKAPILATTPSSKTARRLSLTWGVYAVVIPLCETVKESIEKTVEKATEIGFVHDGELVVITAGAPMAVEGNTNLMRVHVIGRPI